MRRLMVCLIFRSGMGLSQNAHKSLIPMTAKQSHKPRMSTKILYPPTWLKIFYLCK